MLRGKVVVGGGGGGSGGRHSYLPKTLNITVVYNIINHRATLEYQNGPPPPTFIVFLNPGTIQRVCQILIPHTSLIRLS